MASVCALAVWSSAPLLQAQSSARTLYASVIDKEGAPVLDLQPADFEVKEGGKTIEIATVKLAAKPVRVALIVSDRGSGQFQPGALRFCQAVLNGGGQVGITGISTQPERFSDFSDNADVLRDGLLKVGRRAMSRTASAQLVEAILDATKDVAKDGFRPAIVVMRNGGEGPTPIRADAVREALRRSGAALYAVSTTGTQSVQGGGAPMDAAGISRAAAQSEVQEGMLTLGTILGDGSKESGGHHNQVVATSLMPTMEKLGAELVNQYEISYTLPAGTKPSDRVSVTSKRKGVTVHAPTRVAN
jgi:VWFA-related protein